MKTVSMISAGGLALLTLAGCVHVDEGDWSDSEEIARNTDAALHVCGGPGTVEEVTDDGFKCKAASED